MNAWDELPNAKHIDRVLTSLKENPKAWDAAWGAARTAARTAARSAAQGAAWTAAYDAARDAAYDAAWNATPGAARIAAHGAIAALVAYDHCEKYLSMTQDELLVWWKLSEDPACILLLPMVSVLQTEKEMA